MQKLELKELVISQNNTGLENTNLGFGQFMRKEVGLPHQGAQPAFVYISLHDYEAPNNNKTGMFEGERVWIGTVPADIEIITKAQERELVEKFEKKAIDLLTPAATVAQRLYVAFSPAINASGAPINVEDNCLGWSSTKKVEPVEQPRALPHQSIKSFPIARKIAAMLTA